MFTTSTANFILLLRGAPGAGKTTLAEKLETLGLVAASPDEYMFADGGSFDPKRFPRCASKTRAKVRQALMKGKSVVVHQTLTREFEITPYMEIAEEFQVPVFSVIVENRHESEHPKGMSKPEIQKYKDRFSVKL
jgi:predicted kinase